MKRTYGMMRRRPRIPSKYRRARPRSTFIPRPVCQNIVLKRTLEYPTFNLNSTPGVWASANYAFRLQELPAYLEMTNLFDQYRILSVKITWIPHYRDPLLGVPGTTVANTGTFASATPIIWLAPTDDGSANLTDQTAAMQVANAQMIMDPYKPWSRVIKPKAQIEVGTTAAIAGANPKWGLWLDTQNANVSHFGYSIGGAYPGRQGALGFLPFIYSVFAEFTIELKNPK